MASAGRKRKFPGADLRLPQSVQDDLVSEKKKREHRRPPADSPQALAAVHDFRDARRSSSQTLSPHTRAKLPPAGLTLRGYTVPELVQIVSYFHGRVVNIARHVGVTPAGCYYAIAQSHDLAEAYAKAMENIDEALCEIITGNGAPGTGITDPNRIAHKAGMLVREVAARIERSPMVSMALEEARAQWLTFAESQMFGAIAGDKKPDPTRVNAAKFVLETQGGAAWQKKTNVVVSTPPPPPRFTVEDECYG